MSTASATAVTALRGERCVSLTTFRRSGEPVSTPVWVAGDGDTLVATTPAASRKYGLEYRIVMGIERLATSRPGDRVLLRISSPDGETSADRPPEATWSGAGDGAGSGATWLGRRADVARERPVLLKDDQWVSFGDGLAFLDHDLGDGAVVLGFDGHFHLHGFEDGDGVAFFDGVADLDFELPDGAGDVGFDGGHRQGQWPTSRQAVGSSPAARRILTMEPIRNGVTPTAIAASRSRPVAAINQGIPIR